MAVTVTVAPLDELTELEALSVSFVGSLETQLTVRPDRLVPDPSLGVAVSTWEPPTTIGVDGFDNVKVTTGG
jgi:hypothetical protein